MAAPEVTLDTLVQGIFAKPLQTSCVCKDVPRLAGRVTVRGTPGGVLLDAEAGTEPSEVAGEPSEASVPTESAVFRLVHALARLLEPARVDEVCELCRTLYDEPIAHGTESVDACRDLFNALGGEEMSAVVRVLKLLNQNVVLTACGVLRDKLPRTTPMTKDVRSKQGWLIDIEVYSAVIVRHKRREQSLDLFGDTTNHLEMAYEITATMDREAREVTATSLRITDLQLNEEMDPALRMELTMNLASGRLLVA